MSEITEKIKSKGHWNIAIRPASFVDDRVPYEVLDEVIPSLQVRMRGWPVPFVDLNRREFLRGDNWVGQDIDASSVDHYESWRFFTSGQFQHLRSVSADWRPVRVPEGFNGVIEVWEIVYYLTEVFELAARLALGPAGDDVMVVSATLEGLGGRGLIVGSPRRMEFMEPYKSTVPSLTREVELPREKLVAEHAAEAAGMAREFFLRFGWKPSLDQLLDHQRDLTEGS